MDPQRLAKLIDEQAPALVLYARQWCAAPEDVVQEAFVKLARLRQPPDCVAAWLHRVVRNGALSAARSEKRRRRHELAALRDEVYFAPAEGRLDAVAASRALESLAGDLREPVVAHLWGGLTFAEIGELMGISASTAHRRYLEGLAELRRRLRVECPNHPSIQRVAELEADLRQLAPRSGRLDRDALLFAAGRGSACPPRIWQAATVVLGAAVVVLGSLLAIHPAPRVERIFVPVEKAPTPQPETTPRIKPTPLVGSPMHDRLIDQLFQHGLEGLPVAEVEEPPSSPGGGSFD